MDVKITINVLTITMVIMVMVIPSRKATSVCPHMCVCKNGEVTCKIMPGQSLPADVPDDTDILHIEEHYQIFPVESDDLSHLLSHLRNLTRFRLTGSGIKNIKNGTFRTNNKLKYLDLSGNCLESVQIEAFLGLESLIELNLSNNHFSSIPDLCCVTFLRILHLDGNFLRNFTFPEGYKALRYLNEVTINSNLFLMEIPATTFDNIISGNVTKLSLAGGHIRSTAYGVFSNLPNLQSLLLGSYYFLTKYSLSEFHNLLQGLVGSRIQELDLTHWVSVKSLPTGAFSILQDVPLLKLQLAYTGIRHLSAHCFEGLSKLTYLDLSHSQLEEIDSESFAGLTNLKTLNISYTRLKLFIIDIPSLEYLDVSHSDLSNIGYLRNLSNLVELKMNNCHILIPNFFGPSLGQPIRLQTLDLSYNEIIPDTMNIITLNVHSLYLQGNQLEYFNQLASVYIMTTVCTLDLSSNQLRSLVEGFFENLENLEILKLNDNMLGSQLSKDYKGTAFKGLYKLTELHLENNNITTLPSSVFQDLHHLEKLMLKKNWLYHWESSFFQHLLNIQLADFSFNKITSVNESMLLHVSQSTKLNFSGNPFNCDCDLVWLKNSMNTHNKTYLDSTTYMCETPWRIKGVALVQFNPTTMWTSCHNSVLLCIVIIASFLVTAGFAAAVYRYRWKMKVYYYFARHYFQRVKGTIQTENAGNLVIETPEYDAILSSDDDDVDFVENFLLPNTCIRFFEEGAQGVRHNICYPKGDIEWGQSQSQFAEMAQPEKSNKVMIVLSEKYMLTPSKADFELEVARHRRREEGKHVIIIIFIGTAELHAKAPADIRMLLDDNQQTVRWDTRWQEDPERHRDAIQVFYENIKDLLDLQEMDRSLLCI